MSSLTIYLIGKKIVGLKNSLNFSHSPRIENKGFEKADFFFTDKVFSIYHDRPSSGFPDDKRLTLLYENISMPQVE